MHLITKQMAVKHRQTLHCGLYVHSHPCSALKIGSRTKHNVLRHKKHTPITILYSHMQHGTQYFARPVSAQGVQYKFRGQLCIADILYMFTVLNISNPLIRFDLWKNAQDLVFAARRGSGFPSSGRIISLGRLLFCSKKPFHILR